MSTNAHATQDGFDAQTDLPDRDVRALEEYLTVLDDVGRARGAAELYVVVSQSGSEYLVDAREGACECPDHEHRGVRCKHIRRVAFATGERPVPASIDADPQLGEHVDGGPDVVAADGGVATAVSEDLIDVDDDPWLGPFQEADKYGDPTGAAYVRCADCGVEVVTGDKDVATHREGCRHRDGVDR